LWCGDDVKGGDGVDDTIEENCRFFSLLCHNPPVLNWGCWLTQVVDVNNGNKNHHHNHFWPFSGTTWVSRCQKRTSGLYDARED